MCINSLLLFNSFATAQSTAADFAVTVQAKLLRITAQTQKLRTTRSVTANNLGCPDHHWNLGSYLYTDIKVPKTKPSMEQKLLKACK